MKTIAIFGAGITGLAAARELARKGYKVDVYEASPRTGGIAKTFQDPDGFTYDNGPRFIFSTLAEKIGIAEICKPVHYYEYLHVKTQNYRFPFGFIRNPKYCFSIGFAMLTRTFKRKPKNLEDFLYTYYGKSFSKEVLQPLIEKWAGTPAAEVSVDFASRLLPTSIPFIIYSLIKKLRKGITEDYYKKDRYIVYPEGSNAKIFDALMQEKNFSVHLNSPLTSFETKDGKIISANSNEKKIQADYFISTIPVSTISELIKNDSQISQWSQFRYRLIRILFVKLDQDRVMDGLWHWYPENQYSFYRISEYKNGYAGSAPKDKTVISIEFALSRHDPFVTLSDEDLFDQIYPQLEQLHNIRRDKVIRLFSHTTEHAYPILRTSTESIQRKLDHQTSISNLFIAGRTGMHQYKMTEGSYDSAIECANLVDSVAKGKKYDRAKSQYDFSDAYGRPNQIPE